MDYKQEDQHLDRANSSGEKASFEGANVNGQPVAEHVHVTEEDSRRICRKIDLNLLPILVWVYFLQILDKSIVGYSTVFGLKQDANLVGNQYSQIGAMGYYAQLVAQPLGAYLLVKFSVKHLLPISVFCWGIALCGMAAGNNFKSLAATRFLLGWFEAMAIPIFSLITVSWYRRSEQPLRVAAWYASNGWGSLFGSLIAYGCGHIKSSVLHSYQIIFLLNGLITVVTGAVLYWFIPHGVHTAPFLTPEDRLKGVERLRANNTGLDEDNKFKWRQAIELFCEPKTYLFLLMSVCVNMGASVVSVFAPLLLQGLAGFDAYTTSLLNVPFGALQVTVIFLASWAATRWRLKSPVFMAFMLPVVVGTVLMYTLPRTPKNKSALLFGYYMLAFVFSANPIILAWIAANTAGTSKKSSLYCAFNAASAVGNIISPQLFKSEDAPLYLPGLKATLSFFCVLEGLIVAQVFVLFYLNKRKERQRVANGKPAKVHDISMDAKFDNSELVADTRLQTANLDMTDAENDLFVFVY
ncbi:major facilitator superfamily transporter [Leucosporidium creatinivorum]|uniref:Major facilitator superfamily transporter n=1 Tax=Leucosporidium creatinivorum TaxID=106004 RepID=A0A1Y2FVT2_9BASI|nr:major facilitator superfamily transporter [Leucosporidium creatinivorum]